MTPLLVSAVLLSAPAAPPSFTASGTGDEAQTGELTAISLSLGAQVATSEGEKVVKGLVSLRRSDKPVPALPVGAQLVTAGGDRIPGSVSGGDAKVIQFRPTIGSEDWTVALDA